MNFGVVIVNLLCIVMEFNGDMDKFWEIFNECMSIVRDVLVYCVECVKEVILVNVFIFY